MQHLARIACVLAVAPVLSAHAQSQPAAPPHVPAQILSAKRAFVANAGSDTYGADTYFRLTKYGGGPDRFYNAYYNALKTWNRYELVDTPAEADIVLQLRFANPIVDRQVASDGVVDPNTAFVTPGTLTTIHDPQLDLTVIDPKTHVTLWNLTEHIQPAKNQTANDTNFDQAVDRLVGDTKTLAVATPEMLAMNPALIHSSVPPGAYDVARREARTRNAGIGGLAGLLAGVAIDLKSQQGCSAAQCASFGAFQRNALVGVGTFVAGAAIGWLWPTHD